jgi:hypothetical protein
MSVVANKLLSMHTTFIDEAFSEGHFFMCALVIDGEQLQILEKEFQRIMSQLENAFPNEISRNLELHAGEIFNGKGPWRKAFEGNRQRYEVLNHFSEVLAGLNLRILIHGIDVKRQEIKYSLPTDPRYLSLRFLIEKLDKVLHSTSDVSMLICDSGASNQEIQHIRDLLVDMQINGTGGLYPRQITQIVDTVHFSDSKRSRGIQAVDLISFLRHRLELQRANLVKRDSSVDQLWQVLETKVVYDRIWLP